MVKFQTYRHTINKENNSVYDFIAIGSKPYPIEIEIDELNDHKIIKTSCTCPDHKFRERTCKHIKASINELTNDGIESEFKPSAKEVENE